MDRHKALHKDNSRNANINQRINQERRSIRANERKDRFLLSRNIEASPNPQILTENTNETNQIGVDKQVIDGENAHSSRIAIVANKTEGAKLTRQEMFLKRFIDWKATKKHQEAVKRQNKEFERKPFIAAGSLKMGVGRNDTKTTVAKTVKSFAPKNHKFKAPEGIENKAPNYKSQCTTANNAKQRQSFYTVVLTPDKKKPEKKVCGTKDKILINKNTLAFTKQQKGEHFQIQSAGQVRNSVVTNSGARPKIGPASTWALPHSNKRVLPRTESHKFVKPPPLVLSQKTKSSTSVARVVKPVASISNRFIPGTKPGGGGAVGKIKKILPHDTKQKVKHSVPMKAKKSNTASRQPATKPNLNKKTLLALTQCQNTIAETPTDSTNVNPYSSFVTSTKLKSSSKSPKTSFLDIDPISCEISPVEALEDLHVKRTILPNTEIVTKPLAKAQEAPNTSEGKSKKSKFNFVRYSTACSLKEAENSMYVELNNENIETKTDRIEQTQADINEMPMLTIEENIANKITSEGSPIDKGDAPIYYLSPYVSVSRGKGSLKKEREKRNSVYVLENQLNYQSPALGVTDDKAISLSVRRTLETIRYFRKQLTDEIARLHTICDQWEAYKLGNLECLQANGGEDMINVAIGQTKLLTSKKFMQFSGLIDRCERGATSESNIINDGSEDTKPITAVDLEGFWSMVGLQIENVEKRFHNLELWRDNGWIDPEEVKPKAAIKLLAKVQKPKSGTTTVGSKAKPSSGLQKMLRKMHADMRKKKALGVESTENDIILTPSRKHQTENNTRLSTPRRISILVKNKKLHSPSPTILTIYTPRRRSSFSRRQSILPQESPKLLSHVNDFKKSLTNLQQNAGERNELWMHALKGADQQRKMSIAPIDSPSINKTPLGLKGRKSILKTPGTAKGNAKNVIFNEKLRIKKFKFTIESDEEEADVVNKSAHEEENTNKIKISEDSDEQGNSDDLRTYTLRTRKVRLRPSGDIEIPKH